MSPEKVNILQVLFFVLPETEPFGRTVLGHVVTALSGVSSAFVAFLPDLVTIVVLYFVAAYLVKLARVVFRGIETATQPTFPTSLYRGTTSRRRSD